MGPQLNARIHCGPPTCGQICFQYPVPQMLTRFVCVCVYVCVYVCVCVTPACKHDILRTVTLRDFILGMQVVHIE